MNTLHRFNRTALAMCLTALAFTQAPVQAKELQRVRVAPMTANAGATATFTATCDPAVSIVSGIGVVQTSLLGTCVDNAQLEARFPTTPDQPVLVNGTATWTSIYGSDGLKLALTGKATPDPANPGFYNAHYQISITGGTGAYTNAKGLGEIDEVVMFTSPSTATTTWNMKGFVVTVH